MDKPKKAWLHKANDNYYTDEQFQQEVAHKPWLTRSYIPFVEETVECPIVEAGKEIMEKHSEVFLKLRISELEDQLKESQAKYIEARKSGYAEGLEEAIDTLQYYADDGQDNHVAQNVLLKLKGEK